MLAWCNFSTDGLTGHPLVTHIDLCLLRSEVPLETGMHVSIKGDFNDSILNGHHVFNLVGWVPSHCGSSKSSSLEQDTGYVKQQCLDLHLSPGKKVKFKKQPNALLWAKLHTTPDLFLYVNGLPIFGKVSPIILARSHFKKADFEDKLLLLSVKQDFWDITFH